MTTRVTTQIQTPEHIVNEGIAFVVPSYQRPYVWPDDAVRKLLDDIVEAWTGNADYYYIGTLLAAKRRPTSDSSKGPVYELIDGQQRITTLFLIALALYEYDNAGPLNDLFVHDDQPRLTFAIREQVQALLGHWAGLSDFDYPGDQAIDGDDYLRALHSARRTLQQHLAELATDPQFDGPSLKTFVWHNVRWITNVMPESMNANRLFITMNTSGIQLAQSDILKSHLLKKVDPEDKNRCEAIWQACENMGGYFERNVWALFDVGDVQPEDFAVFDRERFKPKSPGSTGDDSMSDGRSIRDLANDGELDHAEAETPAAQNDDDDNSDDQTPRCTSIIDFPLLLIHAYRIYRQRKSQDDIATPVKATRLIEASEGLTNASNDDVQRFLECLWQVRYEFDRWVIKWVEDPQEADRQLRLTTVRKRTRGSVPFDRSSLAVGNLVQLQSVLYFTGARSAQYWLTPLLGYLVANKDLKECRVCQQLERIDNLLSLAEDTGKNASYKLLYRQTPAVKSFERVKNYLRQAHGVGFGHYWFQKLEYLLWKEADKNDDRIRQYRIVSRNSVEHVHPQNEEYGQVKSTEYLDSFGNLVLINVSQNASYSHQAVPKKKHDFYAKESYDALKLHEIFKLLDRNDPEDWSERLIKGHREDMIEILARHYRGTAI